MRPYGTYANGLALLLVLLVSTACTKVKLNNEDKAAALRELKAPTVVLSVSPPSGTGAGGTLITIRGTGFKAGSTVTVGGVACANVSVVSNTEITCVTPIHAVGSVDVVVTPPNGNPGVGTNLYAYVTAVNPVPGYAITSGGGISKSATIMVQAAVGEVGTGNILVGSNMSALTGVHGVLWTP